MTQVTSITLQEIDSLTKVYADARGVLAERVQALQDELDQIRRRRLPGIKLAVGGAKAAESELERALAASRELFQDPRTIAVHGIRVGYMKGKGRIEWADEADLVRRVEKSYAPDVAARLIKVTKKVQKKALGTLSAAELRKLGCTVTEAGDAVYIKPVDDEVDKLVKALLDEETPDPDAD